MARAPFKKMRWIRWIRWPLPALIIFIIFFPSLFAPFPPGKLAMPYALPGGSHYLGTDTIGADNFSLLVYSMKTSLLIGFSTAIATTLLGGFLGIASGYHRGRTEKAIMAATDLFLLVPALPLLILLAAYSNPGPCGLAIILSFLSWPSTARVVRSAVLPYGDMGFIRSAKGFGASSLYITTQHIIPHIKGIIIGKALTVAAGAMAAEGGIAFLGLADPQTMSWGAMIHDAFIGGAFINNAYWWYLPPAAAISFAVLVLTLLGKKYGEPGRPNLFADIVARQEETPASHTPRPDGVLSINNLTVTLAPFNQGPAHTAIKDLSLHLRERERLAIIGQTGGGKSILLAAILRLLPETATLAGRVCFKGINLLALSARDIRRFRAKDIVYVPQGAVNSFNPLLNVGGQIIEALRIHDGVRRRVARKEAVSLIRRLGAADPEQWMKTYPHRMSGGMIQRALVAAALLKNAPLILMDEPTKGLDRDSSNAVLREILNHSRQSFVIATHDLAFARQAASSVAVFYASRIVEMCNCETFFKAPRHPYSRALLDSLSEEEAIPMTANDFAADAAGKDACPFRPWCREAFSACSDEPPAIEENGHLVRCWQYAD